MSGGHDKGYEKNWRRALLKLCLIGLVLCALVFMTQAVLRSPLLERIKFNLSLQSLVGIVFAVNILCLFLIGLLYLAYQWVRRDLKPPRREEPLSLNDE